MTRQYSTVTHRMREGEARCGAVLMMLSLVSPSSSWASAVYCTSEKVHTEPLYTAVPNSSTWEGDVSERMTQRRVYKSEQTLLVKQQRGLAYHETAELQPAGGQPLLAKACNNSITSRKIRF